MLPQHLNVSVEQGKVTLVSHRKWTISILLSRTVWISERSYEINIDWPQIAFETASHSCNGVISGIECTLVTNVKQG